MSETRRHCKKRVCSVLCFVPRHYWRESNLPHACEESEGGEYQRSPYELILVEEGDDVEGLGSS